MNIYPHGEPAFQFPYAKFEIEHGSPFISQDPPTNILIITDPGKDLDDEQALILAAGLAHTRMVNILGVIANLEPAHERARLALGTLNQLGLSPLVGVGTNCFKGGQNLAYETDVPYLAKACSPFSSGIEVFDHAIETSRALKTKFTIVCNSGLTDLGLIIINRSSAFVECVDRVVIMGGLAQNTSTESSDEMKTMVARDDNYYLVPDDAANNTFDWTSSLFVYLKIQQMRIPLVVVTKIAAYAAKFPFSTYDKFKETGNPIGSGLLNRQKPSINSLWRSVNAPEGSAVRGKLPMSRDKKWFADVFCNGVIPDIGPEDEVWDFVGTYNQYDTLAVMAAIPKLHKFFEPMELNTNGVKNLLIGHSPGKHCGVRDPDELRDFIVELQTETLRYAVSKLATL